MLTLRGIFNNNEVIFLDEAPSSGEFFVLVTFLDGDPDKLFSGNEQADARDLLVKTTKIGPRKLEVLRLAQLGRSKAEIAEELELTGRTVRVYLSHVYHILKVRNLQEAINKAVAMGLLGPTAASEPTPSK